jgi:hypothetical protein
MADVNIVHAVSAAKSVEAGAPEVEVTSEMIWAGVMIYGENAGEGWSNPGIDELRRMVRLIFEEMLSSRPLTR